MKNPMFNQTLELLKEEDRKTVRAWGGVRPRGHHRSPGCRRHLPPCPCRGGDWVEGVGAREDPPPSDLVPPLCGCRSLASWWRAWWTEESAQGRGTQTSSGPGRCHGSERARILHWAHLPLSSVLFVSSSIPFPPLSHVGYISPVFYTGR
jgi:hypothetical protein